MNKDLTNKNIVYYYSIPRTIKKIYRFYLEVLDRKIQYSIHVEIKVYKFTNKKMVYKYKYIYIYIIYITNKQKTFNCHSIIIWKLR